MFSLACKYLHWLCRHVKAKKQQIMIHIEDMKFFYGEVQFLILSEKVYVQFEKEQQTFILMNKDFCLKQF
jgi:hypothetical protein